MMSESRAELEVQMADASISPDLAGGPLLMVERDGATWILFGQWLLDLADDQDAGLVFPSRFRVIYDPQDGRVTEAVALSDVLVAPEPGPGVLLSEFRECQKLEEQGVKARVASGGDFVRALLWCAFFLAALTGSIVLSVPGWAYILLVPLFLNSLVRLGSAWLERG